MTAFSPAASNRPHTLSPTTRVDAAGLSIKAIAAGLRCGDTGTDALLGQSRLSSAMPASIVAIIRPCGVVLTIAASRRPQEPRHATMVEALTNTMTAVAETAVEVGGIVPTWISVMATTAAQTRRLRRVRGATLRCSHGTPNMWSTSIHVVSSDIPCPPRPDSNRRLDSRNSRLGITLMASLG
jgi:hypothetical protein